MKATERRRIRVLVVDDEPDVRDLVQVALGFEADLECVAVAGDGEEAVRKAEAYRPDVVVLDNAMPGLSGLATVPLLRAVSPGTAVVMFSAHPKRYAGRGEAEPDAWLCKTKGILALGAAVRAACRQTV